MSTHSFGWPRENPIASLNALARAAPDLFLHLSESDLVVFKGDLNHRKVNLARSRISVCCG